MKKYTKGYKNRNLKIDGIKNGDSHTSFAVQSGRTKDSVFIIQRKVGKASRKVIFELLCKRTKKKEATNIWEY